MMFRDSHGFTLIELVVALVLLAMIATAAAPMMQISSQRAKEKELKQALWQIRDAIDAYKQAADDGRVYKSADDSGYPPNLRVLVEGVINQKDPKKQPIYFLRQLPVDPFNSDSSISAEEMWQKRSYRQAINPQEESPDVYDIHSKSTKLGLNNVPYNQW